MLSCPGREGRHEKGHARDFPCVPTEHVPEPRDFPAMWSPFCVSFFQSQSHEAIPSVFLRHSYRTSNFHVLPCSKILRDVCRVCRWERGAGGRGEGGCGLGRGRLELRGLEGELQNEKVGEQCPKAILETATCPKQTLKIC